MRLFLIRHGQIIGNVRGALDTQLPGPLLTDLGQEQANALVDTLREEPIVAIYASQAVHAQQTAAPLVAALGHEVQVIDGVKEVAVGELEGAADPESTHICTCRSRTAGSRATSACGCRAARAAKKSSRGCSRPSATCARSTRRPTPRASSCWSVMVVRCD